MSGAPLGANVEVWSQGGGDREWRAQRGVPNTPMIVGGAGFGRASSRWPPIRMSARRASAQICSARRVERMRHGTPGVRLANALERAWHVGRAMLSADCVGAHGGVRTSPDGRRELRPAAGGWQLESSE